MARTVILSDSGKWVTLLRFEWEWGIEAVYPHTQVQLCIVHQVRNSLRYVGWKERKAVAADLRTIYSSATLEGAEEALDAFAAKWDEQFPTISPSWRNNWERLIVIFDFPPEIRKVIYTTNAIESLNASLRKITVATDVKLAHLPM